MRKRPDGSMKFYHDNVQLGFYECSCCHYYSSGIDSLASNGCDRPQRVLGDDAPIHRWLGKKMDIRGDDSTVLNDSVLVGGFVDKVGGAK